MSGLSFPPPSRTLSSIGTGHGCCQYHPCSRSWMLSVSPLLQVMDAVSVTPAPGHGCCQCHPCYTLCLNRALFRHRLSGLAGECCSVIAWVALWGVLFRHRLGSLAEECCSVIALVALLKSVVPSLPGWPCWVGSFVPSSPW